MHHQQVGVAIDEGDRGFATEVYVGFVDDDHRLAMRAQQLLDRCQGQQAACGSIRVREDDAAVGGCIVFHGDPEVLAQRHRHVGDFVECAVDRIEAVSDVGEEDRQFVPEQRHEGESEHLVGTVANEDLLHADAELAVAGGNRRAQPVGARVGIEPQQATVCSQLPGDRCNNAR
jgi:hypothetical protein